MSLLPPLLLLPLDFRGIGMTEKLPAETLDPEGFRIFCLLDPKGFRIFVLARNIDSSHHRSQPPSTTSIPWPWCGNNSRVQHHGRISIVVDAIISIYRERGCVLPSREAKTTGVVVDFVVYFQKQGNPHPHSRCLQHRR